MSLEQIEQEAYELACEFVGASVHEFDVLRECIEMELINAQYLALGE